MSRRLVLVLGAAGAGQAAQYLARPMTSYRLLALGARPHLSLRDGLPPPGVEGSSCIGQMCWYWP